MSDTISKNFLYKSALEKLRAAYGSEADELWHLASELLDSLMREHPEISGARGMMVLPAVALYQVIEERHPSEALTILKAQGSEQGEKFKKILYGISSFPGVSYLLKKNMPSILDNMSSEAKGYQRRDMYSDASSARVDITMCPFHELAKSLGAPEACQLICAADKIYMTGLKGIAYERTKSVAEGDDCCDYRLKY